MQENLQLFTNDEDEDVTSHYFDKRAQESDA